MKIEIDDELADKIIIEELKWHIKNTKKDIRDIKSMESVRQYKIEDYDYLVKLLPALGEYFGVSIK